MGQLRSMTGFGAAAGEARSGAQLRVEIRAVNHRHLVLKMRVPEALAALESEIESRVRAKCERGALTLNLAVDPGGAGAGARIDRELARHYRRELELLAKELGLEPTLSLDTLVALPGVVREEDGTAQVPERTSVLALVDQALARLLAMRATEGEALAADLRKNARALAQLSERIAKRMPRVVSRQRTSLEKRLQGLLGDQAPVARSDLAREIALLADKLDVSEELTRLASHLQQLEDFVKKGGRIGRQLDFLVQEVFREVNTIGAKCSDATVAYWAVEAKAHVERLREQVQNVE